MNSLTLEIGYQSDNLQRTFLTYRKSGGEIRVSKIRRNRIKNAFLHQLRYEARELQQE